MATKAALRAVARRIQDLDAEIALADERLVPVVNRLAPTTLALSGVGPQVAAQLMVTAGDNPNASCSPG